MMSAPSSTIRLRRLNMDNSWEIHWGKERILLDPWLIGPEIDGFKQFNMQWLSQPAVALDQIAEPNRIVISQPYSDHCHELTLHEMPSSVNIEGVDRAIKRLTKQGFSGVGAIGDFDESLKVNVMRPYKAKPPLYEALVISLNNDYIFYAPHGFGLHPSQMEEFRGKTCRLLITTFTDFRLPFFLGGVINPGADAALRLAQQLGAEYVTNTHDDAKPGKGLVLKLAKVEYPNWDMIVFSPPQKRLVAENYDWMEI